MKIDPIKFGEGLGGVIRDAIQPLRDRLAKLENASSIDGAIVEAIEGVAARLDELDRHAIRWGGYWSSAVEVQPGFVYVSDGGLWLADNDAVGKPGQGARGWSLLARK